MASELIVQNLKGPASGSNANKVIIPSGHTLDASSGFTPAVDQIVQHKHMQLTGANEHTSSSFTAVHQSMSFAAKHSNSVLRINVQLNVSIDQISTTDAGMTWSVFKDGTNLVSDNQYAVGFYYMYGSAHTNSHSNQSAVLYINAGDTSSHTFQVYTKKSHGTCRVKNDGSWARSYIDIMEIAQ